MTTYRKMTSIRLFDLKVAFKDMLLVNVPSNCCLAVISPVDHAD